MEICLRKELLDYLLWLAKNAYPNEFMGFLREKEGIFEEVLIAPNINSGPRSVFFNPWLMPHDETIRGTVHSHPSPVPWPSEADLEFFSKFGGVHIILYYPFTYSTIAGYSSRGDPLPVRIID